MTATEDTRAELRALRATLTEVRQEIESIGSPTFMEKLGMSLLQALVRQSAQPTWPLGAVSPEVVPESPRETVAPVPPSEPSVPPSPLTTETYVRTLAAFPIPGLIVEADGTILAANIP